MPQKIKVSIIVPVYNVEKYIDECIQSLISQDMKDWEAILVDDGSTDSSGKICDEYARIDSRIKVIHKEHRGTSFAKNTGLRIATGKYITFCDGDDSVLPNWLSDLYIGITTNDCDYCCCSYTRNVQTEHEYKHKLSTGIYKKSDFLLLHTEHLLSQLWDKIFDRDIIFNNNLCFDENVIGGEDLLFVLSYIECTSQGFYFVNKKNYIYKVNDSSITYSLDGIYRKDFWKKSTSRYKHMVSDAKKAGCSDEECCNVYCAILLDFIYRAIKNNFLNTTNALLCKLNENRKLICDKEYRKAVKYMARNSCENRGIFLAKNYLRLMIFQYRLILINNKHTPSSIIGENNE